MNVESLVALRRLYEAPQQRAVKKQIPCLDVHCRRFIELSPFVILATSDNAHNMDASPRGGAPGFAKVTESGDLLLPDAPGNNRLDSFENILSTGKVGLLFLIRGFDRGRRCSHEQTLDRRSRHRLPVVLRRRHRALRRDRRRSAHRAAVHPVAARRRVGERRVRTARRGRGCCGHRPVAGPGSGCSP